MTSPEADCRALRLLAGEAGYGGVARELEALERRSREGRFYVAVVGQFKRGKSTLINGLLETSLLPTGVAPVTSVVTVLCGGAERRATAHHRELPSIELPIAHLADYVTEQGNPGNWRGATVVEVEWPAPLLASGLCLVDTPGVGSIFAANARETHAFVPHIDAALLVLGVDPPISAAEMELVLAIRRESPPLIVVINKADLVGGGDLDAGVAFTRRALGEALGREPPVLVVSARAALEHRPLADGRPGGGLPDLRAALQGLAGASGAELARRALVRGVARSRQALAQALDLERRTLTEPAAALAERERAIAELARRIDGFLRDFSYQLGGELDRFAEEMERRRDGFIEACGRDAGVVAADVVAAVEAARGVDGEHTADERAWALLEKRLKAWVADLVPWVDARQRALTERFTAQAGRLLADVQLDAAAFLGDVPLPDAPAPRFAPAARYYLAADAEVGAIDASAVLDRLRRALLPRALREKRIRRRLAARVERWARHNATRVVSEITLAARDARRTFEADLDRTVRELGGIAATALFRARERRAEGEAAVAAQVSRLDDLARRCREEPLVPA